MKRQQFRPACVVLPCLLAATTLMWLHLQPHLAAATGVELNPTVMILGVFDWEGYQSAPPYTSRCTDSVNRAAKFGSTRINFVPTMYWADKNGDGMVDHYCYMDSNMNCHAHNQSTIDYFKWGLELCFKRAVEQGLSISIVPHLDDSGRSNAWRNGLVFSPTQKHNGISYEEMLLNPIADALNAVIEPWTKVWLATQGEMSATIMRYPREYVDLTPRIKGRIVNGKKDLWNNINIGVSFNFNKLERANTGGSFLGSRGISLFGRGRGNVPGIDYSALKDLFYTVDFVGISSYAALRPGFDKNELQDAAFQFFLEFKDAGMDVSQIIKDRGIEFHYSEYGLGGGKSASGDAPAYSGAEAAHTPFFGVWGPYKKSMDPWQNADARSYLHYFYRQTLDWLSQGGGPTYPVHACFLWGMGSWDILAIYPESSTPEGSYYDGHVASMIKDHNTKLAVSK